MKINPCETCGAEDQCKNGGVIPCDLAPEHCPECRCLGYCPITKDQEKGNQTDDNSSNSTGC